MTGQATFGDLLDSARRHLDQAGGIPGRPEGDRDLLDVARGMHAVVTMIGRHLQDAASAPGTAAYSQGAAPSPWPGACLQARRAADSAARHLRHPDTPRRTRRSAATARGRHLIAAALSLAAARDLLKTHVTIRPDGTRRYRSGWGPAIASPAASRALTAEMAALARQIAALGTGLAMPPAGSWTQTSDARRAMNAACQNLRMLSGTVRAAHQRDPVLAGDRDLLRAIPVSVAPQRQLPHGTEPVTTLCHGVITAAGRLRHSARQAAAQSPSSPQISAAALRDAAAASTAASHNCAVLLHTLASGTDGPRSGGTPARYAQAAEAAGTARDWWLRVARTLDQVTSDIRGHVPADTADTRDLALWTGRLAYADPGWTLASGPGQPARPAGNLATGPQETALVVAAVHHASDALRQLADVHHKQAHSAARADRFLVPTRSLPDTYDIPRPYGPAPPDRIGLVLTAYQHASTASSEAVASVAEVAAVTRAPSRVLSLARAATAESRGEVPAGRAPEHPADIAVWKPPDIRGPFERTLQNLGITSPELLRRSVAIDRAGEELLIEASTRLPSPAPVAAEPGSLATWPVRRADAPSDRSMASTPRPFQQPERESPEAER